ncbi:hypothetical protein PRIPAC_88515 [Pristionchus pacificus]|uniref:Uncharacterized protein n=1 Tax=Pristionchus pacificus TaxID=54126 RepID=A0A2A6B9A5_PRIPA|nr:hypothetical protein PRIPAC_88515 [Pristionchus pacificus]|eukprot:PDM62447.1 hypothetical protein PRIPAC_51889 [Pristionchus pacificus]
MQSNGLKCTRVSTEGEKKSEGKDDVIGRKKETKGAEQRNEDGQRKEEKKKIEDGRSVIGREESGRKLRYNKKG